MTRKHIATTLVAASVALSPVASQASDLGAAIAGAIVGGIIVNEVNKNKQRQRATSSRATASSSQREANREVQVALNYFGYPVGTPDGAIGPRSRSAISQFQATLGYPPSGQLTEFERTILVSAYHRSVAGGPQVMQVMASHPMGVRGMLMVQRDEMTGAAVPGGGIMAAAPVAPAVPVQPTQPVAVAPAAPAAPAVPALPSFMGSGAVMASLASHCNKVSLLTNTNGGFVTAATMTDPTFALSEQFCLARTYAMAQGEEIMSKVAGFTPAQIAEQCAGFVPVLKDQIASVSLKSRDEVLQGVSGFVLQSGMAPAQLAGTARVCLGVGYTTDNLDVAIGSALLLTVLGEKSYAELLGHHLVGGFGASQRPDLALPWYEMSLEAGTGGTTTVFAPGMPDRAALIRKAAFTVGGRPDQASLQAPVPAALPTFTVTPTPAPAVTASAAPQPAATMAGAERTGVEALPLAARLPFLLFRN